MVNVIHNLSDTKKRDKKITVHILYPSGWDVNKWSANHEKGLVPDKYQYGFDRLEKHGFNVTFARFPQLWIMKKTGALFTKVFTQTYNPYYFTFQLKHFLEADVFINPLDYEGLLVCWLRKHKILNLHKKKHIFTAAWLPALVQNASKRELKKLRSLIATVDVLMCFGEHDKRILKEYLSIPEEKVERTYWGVDAKFFKPCKTESNRTFLAPGNDQFRDFETLAEVASDLPQEQFLIASNKKIILKTNPPNLSISAKSHKELVHCYMKAKAIIIPLKKGCPTVSGSTVVKEALLLNKKIIVSSTDSMRELFSRFKNHVILVEPGNKESLKEAIANINCQKDKLLPELTPEQKIPLSSEYYMEKLAQIMSRRIENSYST
jgi:glycosyltransferase involved in cell wall biosynthesis